MKKNIIGILVFFGILFFSASTKSQVNFPAMVIEGLNLTSGNYPYNGKYTGLYWGVLATEYYLLNKNGQYDDATNTLNELYLALNAVKTY